MFGCDGRSCATGRRCVAAVGVTVFRAMFPERRGQVAAGRQPERIGDSTVFVLPNPSGRNANYSYQEMLEALCRWQNTPCPSSFRHRSCFVTMSDVPENRCRYRPERAGDGIARVHSHDDGAERAVYGRVGPWRHRDGILALLAAALGRSTTSDQQWLVTWIGAAAVAVPLGFVLMRAKAQTPRAGALVGGRTPIRAGLHALDCRRRAC